MTSGRASSGKPDQPLCNAESPTSCWTPISARLRRLSAALVDLRHINQWFGGIRATTDLLRRVAARTNSRRLSVLEVGAGGGDVPLAARKTLAAEGIQLDLTLLDRISTHLPRNGAPAVAGDALHLPFRDGSFDVVSCSLLAHHFDPDVLRAFAREALRVARRAVVINDLARSRLHLLLVYLGLPLFRSRITWHDAPASVRRAYTARELRELLSPVAPHTEITTYYLFRLCAILWK